MEKLREKKYRKKNREKKKLLKWEEKIEQKKLKTRKKNNIQEVESAWCYIKIYDEKKRLTEE